MQYANLKVIKQEFGLDKTYDFHVNRKMKAQ